MFNSSHVDLQLLVGYFFCLMNCLSTPAKNQCNINIKKKLFMDSVLFY